ncbi:MAG TPA: ThiF family adenylyltransferase [Acidimicrobiales bacterium]|nr:ThiF family adenylyltransferase [Acidimicrobiales bacterium]
MNDAILHVPDELWRSIEADLLSTPDLERAAVGFAGVRRNGSAIRLLLRDWAPVPSDEYLVQLGHHLEVSPVFWARAAKRCRSDGEAVVIMHSHPRDSQRPRFSPSDDAGEAQLVPKIRARAEVPIGAVVVSPGGSTARFTENGNARPMALSVVGAVGHQTEEISVDAAFDRQVLALGRDGQRLIRGLRVGVVGAGGLGSHVVQQLVHLGAGHIVVVDPDRVTVTNLSRLVGASRLDVMLRRKKTRLVRRLARRTGRMTAITEISESVETREAAESLLRCDVVFGCTDNQVSRTILNVIAFQYYTPVMDLGVELQTTGAMGGRVTWLAPGGACLWCMGVLDAERVRVEQLTPELRADEEARGYIQGLDEPAPAVVSINGVVASLAVTEMLARFTGFAGRDSRSTLLLYRLVDGVVRRTSPSGRAGCPTCSKSGLLGAGDLAIPPWRGGLA